MFLKMDQTYQIGKNALDASSLRQQAIAHNVANATTKGYKSKQVQFEESLKKALNRSSSQLKTTNDRHLGGGQSATTIQAKVKEISDNTFMNLDGNNVDIDSEMANMAANQIQYNALIQTTNTKLQNYRSVIKG